MITLTEAKQEGKSSCRAEQQKSTTKSMFYLESFGVLNSLNPSQTIKGQSSAIGNISKEAIITGCIYNRHEFAKTNSVSITVMKWYVLLHKSAITFIDKRPLAVKENYASILINRLHTFTQLCNAISKHM